MREYTAIVTITVVVSVMAESEREAEDRCSGFRLDDGPGRDRWYVPTLMHPQVIGLAAFSPTSVSFDGFAARSFKEAYRDCVPYIEPGCEPKQAVFPPGHPAIVG